MTTWTPETLSAEIARRVEAARGRRAFHADLRPDQRGRFPDAARAVHRSRRRRGRGRDRAATGAFDGGGTSDARFIKTFCPVVELGLTNATIHAVDERVALEDLEALTRIYERVLERYFA